MMALVPSLSTKALEVLAAATTVVLSLMVSKLPLIMSSKLVLLLVVEAVTRASAKVLDMLVATTAVVL